MEPLIECFQHVYGVKPVKQLAGEMHITPITLYRWGELGEQHRTNPAEYMVTMTRATGNLVVVNSTCEALGGVFVPNPPVNGSAPANLLEARNMVTLLKCEFVRAMARLGAAKREPAAEAKTMRRHWERFKSGGEAFVRACERGIFRALRCVPLLWALAWWLAAGDVPEWAEVCG